MPTVDARSPRRDPSPGSSHLASTERAGYLITPPFYTRIVVRKKHPPTSASIRDCATLGDFEYSQRRLCHLMRWRTRRIRRAGQSLVDIASAPGSYGSSRGRVARRSTICSRFEVRDSHRKVHTRDPNAVESIRPPVRRVAPYLALCPAELPTINIPRIARMDFDNIDTRRRFFPSFFQHVLAPHQRQRSPRTHHQLNYALGITEQLRSGPSPPLGPLPAHVDSLVRFDSRPSIKYPCGPFFDFPCAGITPGTYSTISCQRS